MSFVAFLPIISNLLDRIIPNKSEAAKARQELELLAARGELDLMISSVTGNLNNNTQDSKHSSVFVAGWRPFIGWICGTTLAFSAITKILLPALVTISSWNSGDITFAQCVASLQGADIEYILSILGTMLGFGALRTYEKRIGKAK